MRFENRTNRGAHARTRSRRLKQPWPSLVVSIAESRWVDGRPRQKIVAYVGTIRTDEVNVPSARRRFWDRASERLEQFTPEAKKRIEESIAARIQRPPAAEPDLSLAQQLAAASARMQALRAARAAQEEIAS